MQIYDGNLLHILKPMTRKTRGGRGASKAQATSSLLPPRAKSREIEADYRVRSRYLDLHPTFDRFSEEIASPVYEWGREKEAQRKAEKKNSPFGSE